MKSKTKETRHTNSGGLKFREILDTKLSKRRMKKHGLYPMFREVMELGIKNIALIWPHEHKDGVDIYMITINAQGKYNIGLFILDDVGRNSMEVRKLSNIICNSVKDEVLCVATIDALGGLQ